MTWAAKIGLEYTAEKVGAVQVEMNDGTQKTYNAGEAFIEDADTFVNNKNPGTEPIKFLAVLPGFKDSPMVIMPETE